MAKARIISRNVTPILDIVILPRVVVLLGGFVFVGVRQTKILFVGFDRFVALFNCNFFSSAIGKVV